jgi:hypothetical protein
MQYTMTLARGRELVSILFRNDPVVKRGFFRTTRRGWRIETTYKNNPTDPSSQSEAGILKNLKAAEDAGCNMTMFVFAPDGMLMFAIAYNALVYARYGATMMVSTEDAAYQKCAWRLVAFFPCRLYLNESNLWKWAGDYFYLADHLKKAQNLKFTSEQLSKEFGGGA